MPGNDSLLLVKINELQQKINCLSDSTVGLKQYINEQQKMPEMNNNISGLVFLLAFFLVTILLIAKSKRIDKFIYSKVSEDKKVKQRNYAWAILWFIDSILIFISLTSWHIIHNPKNFWFSHGDALLVIASIIAVIGAIWAIFARIDAERAFLQSEKTYNALGTMFDFTTFFERDKLQKIYEEIGTKDSNISLYFGFPIVGLPFERRNELDIKPEELFLVLKEKLEHFKNRLSLPNATPFEFSLYIGYIDKDEACDILNDILSDDPVLKKILAVHLNEFYDVVNYFYPIDSISKKRKNISDKIRFIELELKEKFRYVTFKKVEKDVSLNKKTFVWVVDIKEDAAGNFKPFDSKIFQTQDERFLGLLENVFK